MGTECTRLVADNARTKRSRASKPTSSHWAIPLPLGNWGARFGGAPQAQAPRARGPVAASAQRQRQLRRRLVPAAARAPSARCCCCGLALSPSSPLRFDVGRRAAAARRAVCGRSAVVAVWLRTEVVVPTGQCPGAGDSTRVKLYMAPWLTMPLPGGPLVRHLRNRNTSRGRFLTAAAADN